MVLISYQFLCLTFFVFERPSEARSTWYMANPGPMLKIVQKVDIMTDCPANMAKFTVKMSYLRVPENSCTFAYFL
jgi:hypothetical protein